MVARRIANGGGGGDLDSSDDAAAAAAAADGVSPMEDGDGAGGAEKKIVKFSLDENPLLPEEAVPRVAGAVRQDKAALCFSELALLFGDSERAVKYEVAELAAAAAAGAAAAPAGGWGDEDME